MSKCRYWLACHPDVRKPIGGVKQMHRFAEALASCGREVCIIQQEAGFHPGWFQSDVRTIGLQDWHQKRGQLVPERDVVVLPETFLSVFVSYAPGLPKIIFNQNGAYTFGLPGQSSELSADQVLGLYGHPDLLHVLCVSRHDEQLLGRGVGVGADRVSRLINGIETNYFRPLGAKKRQISFMPRKNRGDSAAVLALLRRQPFSSNWSFVSIDGCTQAEVASCLQQSLLFLSFGHPEGFGLPMAEALACGCALAGYSGLGGKELIELAAEHDVGVEVAYGDWWGFVQACTALDHSVTTQQLAVMEALLKVSKQVRQRYSMQAMHSSVAAALARWECLLPLNS